MSGPQAYGTGLSRWLPGGDGEKAGWVFMPLWLQFRSACAEASEKLAAEIKGKNQGGAFLRNIHVCPKGREPSGPEKGEGSRMHAPQDPPRASKVEPCQPPKPPCLGFRAQ